MYLVCFWGTNIRIVSVPAKGNFYIIYHFLNIKNTAAMINIDLYTIKIYYQDFNFYHILTPILISFLIYRWRSNAS
jgi:hypothetical protein